MKSLLATSLLLVCALAHAADSPPVSPNQAAMHKEWEAQRAQMRSLNDQERAAMESVKADKTKSPTAKRDAMRKIHEDYKAKKDALRAQMKAERDAKRAAVMNQLPHPNNVK